MANEVMALSGWEAWHEWHEKILQPIIGWFCDQVGTPGHTVLDVACGTGLPSIHVARRLKPGGRVIATDVSEVMLGAARRKSAAAGSDNIEHRLMDMGALDFAVETFDAVTCSFGLIYSADPTREARELRRVLKPGGQVAISAWDVPEKNAFFTTLFGALGRILELPAPDPRGPGPFRLSAPGELEATLAAAGFTGIEVERREVLFECDSVEMHWAVVSALAAPIEKAMKRLPADELAQLKQAIAGAVGPYTKDGRVRLRNTALCAAGRR